MLGQLETQIAALSDYDRLAVWACCMAVACVWLAWQVARRANAVAIHAKLTHDLLILVAQANMILPIDPHGARVILERAGQLGEDAIDELRERGLWRS